MREMLLANRIISRTDCLDRVNLCLQPLVVCRFLHKTQWNNGNITAGGRAIVIFLKK